MLNFKIFTLFPDLFPGPLSQSITGNAMKNKIWNINAINIRDYALDKHQTVDDTPYGGGAGMLIKPDILSRAINDNNCKKIYYLSPRGKILNQKLIIDIANNLKKEKEISLICGRYEGIDDRVIEKYDIEEISIGDYILSGGEIAAYVFIDSVLRNIDGVLGEKESLSEESFSIDENGFLLEYPQYTKPYDFEGMKVPEILLSGHHKKIKEYRLKKSIEVTKKNRHDLYQKYIKLNQQNDV